METLVTPGPLGFGPQQMAADVGATGLDWGTNMGRTLTPESWCTRTTQTPLWTASSLGIYRSFNGGDNWIRTLCGDYASLEMDPRTPTTYWLANLATTLPKVTTRGPLGRSTVLMAPRLASAASPWPLHRQAPDTVYAVAGKNNDQGFAGFWRSTDGGCNWTARMLAGEGPNLLGWTVDGGDSGGQAWYDLALAVHPKIPTCVHVGGVNLWATEDGGTQWQCAAHWYAGATSLTLHADQHGLKYSG